jgi:iron-sulfur cluster assembly protein
MNELVTLTDKAISHIEQIFESEGKSRDEYCLRLGVVGGGCSGLSYKIDFDKPSEKDNILNFGNFRVAVDPKSSIYMKGIQLDFQDGLNGKGFVFNNPNAKNTCGCGESFTV